MATGASTADAAVVLVDAEKGVRVQTRRHTHIVSLLGVQNVILAVNKMDRIGYDRASFEAIAGEFVAYAHKLGVHERRSDPGGGAARRERGSSRHERNALVHGPHAARGARRHRSRRAPTRSRNCASRSSYVNRPDANFRGYAGTIASGEIAVGDAGAGAAVAQDAARCARSPPPTVRSKRRARRRP